MGNLDALPVMESAGVDPGLGPLNPVFADAPAPVLADAPAPIADAPVTPVFKLF